MLCKVFKVISKTLLWHEALIFFPCLLLFVAVAGSDEEEEEEEEAGHV